MAKTIDELEAEVAAADRRMTALEAKMPVLVAALRAIVAIERRADDVRGSGMVDDADTKAMRAMANRARSAMQEAGVS